MIQPPDHDDLKSAAAVALGLMTLGMQAAALHYQPTEHTKE